MKNCFTMLTQRKYLILRIVCCFRENMWKGVKLEKKRTDISWTFICCLVRSYSSQKTFPSFLFNKHTVTYIYIYRYEDPDLCENWNQIKAFVGTKSHTIQLGDRGLLPREPWGAPFEVGRKALVLGNGSGLLRRWRWRTKKLNRRMFRERGRITFAVFEFIVLLKIGTSELVKVKFDTWFKACHISIFFFPFSKLRIKCLVFMYKSTF